MKLSKTLKLSEAKNWPNITKQMLTDAWQWKADIIVKIEKDEETRHTKQNRLLWKWHSELAKHIEINQGQIFDSEDIHEHVAGKLLPKRCVEVVTGEPEIMRTRTSKLKVKEFADFLTRYEMWAAETYQCLFTKPDDLYFAALMQDAEPEYRTDGL